MHSFFGQVAPNTTQDPCCQAGLTHTQLGKVCGKSCLLASADQQFRTAAQVAHSVGEVPPATRLWHACLEPKTKKTALGVPIPISNYSTNVCTRGGQTVCCRKHPVRLVWAMQTEGASHTHISALYPHTQISPSTLTQHAHNVLSVCQNWGNEPSMTEMCECANNHCHLAPTYPELAG